jgi:RNA polymerase sigma-70 factor (ECF subfamily)
MSSNSQQNLEPEFLRILQIYRQAIRRLCSVYLRDATDREDLFQEIAVALWTALPRFRAAASERTWLYRIAHNVALTYASRRRRQRNEEKPMELLTSNPATEADLLRYALIESVQQLEEVDRQLAILYLEGLSQREMGEVTGLTENNVAVRLSRLRKKLAFIINGREVSS